MDYQFISIMSIVKAMRVCLMNAVTLELEMKTVRKVMKKPGLYVLVSCVLTVIKVRIRYVLYTSRRMHGIFGERKSAYNWGLIV